MRDFNFEWKGAEALKTVLEVPFHRVSMQLYNGRPDIPVHVSFWRSNGSWLTVCSSMHDISDRLEVGILTFEMGTTEPTNEPAVVDMKPSPFVPVDIKKLIIRDEDVVAESGIRLSSKDGKVITIAAGGFPYSLAIAGVRDEIANIFTTEYEIGKYEVVPL